MSESDKVRENRLRRMAERQRLLLRKARRRDPHAWDYGTYSLIDPAINGLVSGEALTLDQVEAYLTESTSPTPRSTKRTRGKGR